MRVACLLLFAALLTSPGAKAQEKPCTDAEADQASNDVDHLKDWNALYRSFKRFANCDHGGDISEGYSDAVAKLLAKHWDELHVLAGLVAKDKPFEDFVVGHIDPTDDGRDIEAIVNNAAKHCPTNQKRLCGLIHTQAESVLNGTLK